ncbi:zinc metalloproteinase nas-15-like [Uranotaenia lowii]|uniref:zinc metalloproteinase nas-15-like n=1 Tax=Uranotaenia lowii TaxID=190385 RepID=UPI00247994E1|nr:zinc metalloproteinase nas-15-like [Uranotaenia lowii]
MESGLIKILLCGFCLVVVATAWPITSDTDAEFSGDRFEGDMVLSVAQKKAIFSGERNGLLDESYRWPNNTLYYTIDTTNFTSDQTHYIRKALDHLEEVSCLRFVETDAGCSSCVRVIGDSGGCYSEVGYLGTVQDLNLAPNRPESGCFRLGTIMHEFLHALGFYHMQSASNRDDYVTIVWDKITSGMEHNFIKYQASEVSSFETQYDYGSVMHYPGTAFSVDGSLTIIPKDPNATIGQRERLSESDILKLKRMYSC